MSEGVEPKPRMICPACNTWYEAGQFCARDGTPLDKDPAARAASLVGQIIADRYRVIRLIGEGGMGQVYEAQHVNINKRFALKLLRPEIVSNPEAVARFRQEAWSASSIGHENIVEIDDFATLPTGAVYLAMEFLQGQSLADRLRDGPPLSTAETIDVFLQVARGLAAAHDKNIIHRDMKPENVFLAEKHGRRVVKILDFGIAKVSGAEGASSLTRTGAIFGTPHYMSPEQAMGTPLDHRSDIYSVGVILYEVLAGRVPFEAESFMGILTKHITVQPAAPSEIASDREVPPELEALTLRAMQKEREQRFATMHELADELVNVAQSIAPELATSQSSIIRAVRPTPASGAAINTPSPMAVREASGPQRLAKTPTKARSAVLQAAAPADAALVEESPKPKSRALLYIALAGLALGGLAAAAVVLRKPAPEPIAVVTPPAKTVPQTQPPPVTKTETTALAMDTVIVDSQPTGAKIVGASGERLGDTPEEVKVEQGKTRVITLQREGFTNESVTVDPSKGRKLVVKLHKIEKPASSSGAVKLPVPPPATTTDSPHHPNAHPVPPTHQPTKPPVYTQPAYTPPSNPPQPPRGKHKPVDPYERLDDGPKRNSGVLNPY